MEIKCKEIEKNEFENILVKIIQKVIILYIILTFYKDYIAKNN